jgi:hypothetical protein
MEARLTNDKVGLLDLEISTRLATFRELFDYVGPKR